VVEAGDCLAYSHDGLTWHCRADDGYGWVRPVGVWVEGEGLRAGQAGALADLLPALESRPALPFRLADSIELWLLGRESGLPLALLASERPSVGPSEQIDPEWHPFALTYTGFRSPTLTREDAAIRQPAAHRDVLARMVNRAAGPLPVAQWFHRQPDGGGEGLAGLRLRPEWEGRRLPAAAFPALLLRLEGSNQLEESVIRDYHAWLAPLLLAWPQLSDETRAWLEAEACRRPQGLLRVHRLLPRVLHEQRLKAALVAARLEQTSGHSENELTGI